MSKPEQEVLANLTAYLMSSITNGLHHWWKARLLSPNAVNGLEALLRPVVHDPDPAALVVLDKLARALDTKQSQNALAALHGKLAGIKVAPAAAGQRVHAALRQAVSAAQLAWRLRWGKNDETTQLQAQRTLRTWGFAVPDGFELSWTAGIGPGQLLVEFAECVTGANLPAGVLLHCLTRLVYASKRSSCRPSARNCSVTAIHHRPCAASSW